MLEKMGAKGQKHVGEKGQKRMNKKPDRSKGGVNNSLDEEGGKRKRLDAMTVGYFRRVSERLSEGFTDDEERDLFVENVLSEVKGQAGLVATDMTGSLALQKLLSLASLKQVTEVLAELGGETGSEFKRVSCDRCGGHVIESAIKQMAKWTEDSISEEKSSSGNEPEETENRGTLEDQAITLCRVVRENLVDFIKDPHGSHVLRTLIHVLAGCSTAEQSDAHPAKKQKKAEPELIDFEAPTSFWWELKYLSESLMENVNVCATNPTASTVLQTLLTICHRKRPILAKKLNKGIMGYLTSLSSAPGVSPLLVFLKDQSCSRLIQVLFQFSQKSLLRDTYKNHLKDQLIPLALHPFANYTVQSLIAASVNYKLFLKVFDELVPGFEAILAAGHMGVVVQLVESCIHREERQASMLQHLLEAFHCNEPSTRLLTCLPLFLSLLTYEVYYNPEAAEGDAVPQRPLSICYHGSRLVQALARFKDRSILMNSLHSLSTAELLSLGTEQTGSHALQALITLSSDKGKGKILRKLEGLYTPLACSKYGSRLLEAVWSSATISQRQSIAEQLVSSESQLRSDQFARHVWAKFSLAHFQKRRGAWMELQTGESKKRKMFSDILE
ncbi:nucleolar protein 9 [Tachysurus fulvidraco]|uniref:nucleolar protein 9 n=1 Tax=Tachysurus fulvidraco TaxID=1234273 RepID=UPI001FED2E3A|nr:nucleolar protein 9 [Tachysurus fulvidraco]XP_027006657.2 nucleolar protein 9 [Tachysurus fulvidraco]XP_027006658.2 nucleolar protein 9 [Tachysurus fulvidraco]